MYWHDFALIKKVWFFSTQLTELFFQAMEEKSRIPLLLSFMCICSEVNITFRYDRIIIMDKNLRWSRNLIGGGVPMGGVAVTGGGDILPL